MKFFLWFIGLWAFSEGLLSMIFPDLMNRLAKKIFKAKDTIFSSMEKSTIRVIGLLEFLFGAWMIALAYFTT